MARWNNSDRTPLAILRADAGYSAERAAALLNVVMITLYRYEKGLTDIPLSIAEKMATLYNVPFDKIREAAKYVRDKHHDEQR